MSNVEQDRKVDRTGWESGPWDKEPDRIEWRHAGMPCLIVRNDSGALCGYAGVAPGHPDHGRDYNDVDVEAHSGLTYADKCQGGICHVPQAGESDDVWWLGFDCAHAWDVSPGNDATMRKHGFYERDDSKEYRGVAYVTEQVNGLAEQLAARAAS